VRDGQLRRRVREQGSAVVGETAREGFVVGEAGVDELGRDTGLERGRVGADGDGGRARGEEGAQAVEDGDRAEVVDGRDE
jgi:hypothetical protein